MADNVLFRVEGTLGRITLNRPEALNALTLPMCEAMLARLVEWAADDKISAVLIDAAPGRAFCAGGDVRAAAQLGKRGDPLALEFFRIEYGLNKAIKHFPKPYVALIDGIVMGGGAGISVNGAFPVVTEHTIFAMPETAIGFFCDVGGSYFLSRCPGETGMFLGLTGARIVAADMIHAGLATHFLPAAAIKDIAPRLAAGEAAGDVLKSPSADPGPSALAAEREKIERAFAGKSVEAILENLGQEGEWGAKLIALLKDRSPTSLKLVHRELREGRSRDFDACMAMEFGIVQRVLAREDFSEGVRAALIDRDKSPRWNPPDVEGVSDAAIARYFAVAPHSLA